MHASQVQTAWREHVAHVRSLCANDFWKVFQAVRLQPARCCNDVLQV